MIKKATGWRYTRSLYFMRAHQDEAREFAKTEGGQLDEALVMMAVAEHETGRE